MRSIRLRYNRWLRLPLFCVIGTMLFACMAVAAYADHETEPTQNQGVASQFAPPAPSFLQVTGNTNRFNISAGHADVLSVLRAIFEQSHQQFVPDTSVNGEVNMVLAGQPFNVVLAAVCKQTFLGYEIDKNGIYQFRRDEQALRAAFARMSAINSVIADQLRRMGYPLPTNGQTVNGAMSFQNLQPGSRGGFGGFGGGAAGRSAGTPPNGPVGPAGTAGAKGDSGQPDQKRDFRSQAAQPNAQANDSSNDAPGLPGGGFAGRSAQKPAPETATGNAPLDANREPLSAYDQLLRDNGLVGVHVQKDQPMPIAEVLKQISRQANVPILIDPQLQGEHPLKFWGNIVRPLPDVLNLLLPAMHLEWRYTGGTIFVTETPDFSIFYGISNIPKVVYPPNGLLQQLPNVKKPQQRSNNDATKNTPQPSKKTESHDDN